MMPLRIRPGESGHLSCLISGYRMLKNDDEQSVQLA